MPAYIHKNNRASVLFVHIPKCGGGSIEQYLRQSNFKQYLYQARPAGFLRCSAQHMHMDLLEQFIDLNYFDAIFSVVRNPVARIISEYKWRIKSPYAKHGIDHWYTKTRDIYNKNPFAFDNHLRPMNAFVRDNSKIFKLEEDMPLIAPWLRQKLPSVSTFQPEIRNQKDNLHQQRVATNPKLIRLYNLATPSEETIAHILNDYREDFKRFNYSTKLDTYLSKKY